ncbi:hypothetical protein ACOME3_006518 [Neoechinorhynchus agilis]
MQRSISNASQMKRTARIEVYNADSIDIELKDDYSARDLLIEVADDIGLRLSEFFGLQVKDAGEEYWLLPLSKPISSFNFISNDKMVIDFKLKQMYHPESLFSIVADQVAMSLFYFDAREKLLSGDLQTDEAVDSITLAALELQMELGDFKNCENLEKCIFETGEFVSFMLADACCKGSTDCIDEVVAMYKSLAGLCQAAACFRFLRTVRRSASTYGYHMFNVETFNGALDSDKERNEDCRKSRPFSLAIGRLGVALYDHRSNTFKMNFHWINIQNFYCRHRRFCLQAKPSNRILSFGNGSLFQNHQYNWFAKSSVVAYFIWQCCVHQHKFYLLNLKVSPNTRSAFEEIFSSKLQLHRKLSNCSALNSECICEGKLRKLFEARKAILKRMEAFNLWRLRQRLDLTSNVHEDFYHADLQLNKLELVCLENLSEHSKHWLVLHKDYIQGDSSKCPVISVHHYLLSVRFHMYTRLNEQLHAIRKRITHIDEHKRWSWTSHPFKNKNEVKRSPSFRSALSAQNDRDNCNQALTNDFIIPRLLYPRKSVSSLTGTVPPLRSKKSTASLPNGEYCINVEQTTLV